MVAAKHLGSLFSRDHRECSSDRHNATRFSVPPDRREVSES